MSNILTFAPRQTAAVPELPQIMSLAERRAHLENALQTSLDTADHIMAALDQWDGDAPVIESRPLLAALAVETIVVPPEPEPTPETPQAEPEPATVPEIRAVALPLPWGGAGNVVSAAGCAVLALLTRARPLPSYESGLSR